MPHDARFKLFGAQYGLLRDITGRDTQLNWTLLCTERGTARLECAPARPRDQWQGKLK
jgi:hypothetical protein